MKKLSKWIQNKSKGWVALASLIIFVLFTALVLPKQANQAKLSTGNEQSPDMSFYYTGDELYQLAEAYGEAGRASYVKARFTFDLVWPFVYMLFLSTVLSWINQKAFKAGSFLQLTNVVPLFGMIFDYLENISTSVVMIRYPEPTRVIDSFATIFTLLKWIFIGGGFALLFLGLIIWIGQLLGRKRVVK